MCEWEEAWTMFLAGQVNPDILLPSTGKFCMYIILSQYCENQKSCFIFPFSIGTQRNKDQTEFGKCLLLFSSDSVFTSPLQKHKD